jgi:hypothetical protein
MLSLRGLGTTAGEGGGQSCLPGMKCVQSIREGLLVVLTHQFAQLRHENLRFWPGQLIEAQDILRKTRILGQDISHVLENVSDEPAIKWQILGNFWRFCFHKPNFWRVCFGTAP